MQNKCTAAAHAPVPDVKVDDQGGGGFTEAGVVHAQGCPVHQLALDVLCRIFVVRTTLYKKAIFI